MNTRNQSRPDRLARQAWFISLGLITSTVLMWIAFLYHAYHGLSWSKTFASISVVFLCFAVQAAVVNYRLVKELARRLGENDPSGES